MEKKVGIVGSGVIGRGWIILFAKAGYDVSVFDTMSAAVDAALEQVRSSLHDLEKIQYLSDATEVFTRVQKASCLEDALADTCYVQESVTEDPAVKEQLFVKMDKCAPEGIPLASSSSAIPPSTFLKNVSGRERCIVSHPFNPPHLIPIVEVVTTLWNSQSIIDQVCALMEEIGQSPVVIRKEIPGHVVSRLQVAVVNEAIQLVDEGVISPRDLDRCMRNGLGLRWALMGPFETMELNAPKGFLDYATKFGQTYKEIGGDLKVDKPWRQNTLQEIENWRRSESTIEKIPERQAWRDKMLVRLRALVDCEGN